MPGAVYEKGYDMKKGRTKSVLTGLFAGILILGCCLAAPICGGNTSRSRNRKILRKKS